MGGWAMLVIRILLYIWFNLSVQALRESGGLKLRDFLQRFQFAGTSYFLAYPAIFLLTQVFAPYLRQYIMYIGLLATQFISVLWLAGLFLSRGTYFQVSALGSSLLPGG